MRSTAKARKKEKKEQREQDAVVVVRRKLRPQKKQQLQNDKRASQRLNRWLFFRYHPNDFFSCESRRGGGTFLIPKFKPSAINVENFLSQNLSNRFLCKILLKCPILKFPL